MLTDKCTMDLLITLEYYYERLFSDKVSDEEKESRRGTILIIQKEIVERSDGHLEDFYMNQDYYKH